MNTINTIVMIHGLRSSPWVMKLLGHRLSSTGHRIVYFKYKSQKYSHNTLKELHQLLSSINTPIHIVAHSMGGLVIRNYLHHFISPIKSIVTIATPHNESICAHNLSKSLFKRSLGTAGASGLTVAAPSSIQGIPLGCIAGLNTSRLSRNLFVPRSHRNLPSDGTVLLSEAIMPGCTDSVEILAAHTPILFKKEVAEQCKNFIAQQGFKKIIYE